MAEEFLSGRGKTYCRGCNGIELFSALDLGELPIANELWISEGEPPEIFPLHLRICSTCGLGQVEDTVTPTRLFRDYRYLSSISTSFIEHARQYAASVVASMEFGEDDWVLEIASNDGYLLQHFVNMDIRVLGIEPAQNVAKIAADAGIPTINEFFGVDLARSIRDKMGHPRLIVANNVMAHVPDLRDFMGGLKEISGPNTLISIENPSLMNLLTSNQFDTIYHEHFSYLTANSVDTISRSFGLELFDIDRIDTHGGSNRYWMRLCQSESTPSKTVQDLILAENTQGLFAKDRWLRFSIQSQTAISGFNEWLRKSFERGDRVCGYGAAAKASTLLNAAKIRKQWLMAIADGSQEKQGRFMPTQAIPIVSLEDLLDLEPTDVVLFPWNIRGELVDEIRQHCKTSLRIWQAIPTIERVY